ncbi:unnamed protein product [Gadus morhua 'NCC']
MRRPSVRRRGEGDAGETPCGCERGARGQGLDGLALPEATPWSCLDPQKSERFLDERKERRSVLQPTTCPLETTGELALPRLTRTMLLLLLGPAALAANLPSGPHYEAL